jgi:pimeloyl-ACP methyl ester carboxylesterase
VDRRADELVHEWERRGSRRTLAGHEVFVVDQPATGAETADPLLVLHGFPSSSFDFRACLDRLAEHRRVLLFDCIGFGLSAKPDVRYGLDLQADVAVELVQSSGIERIDLLTHDMGNSVGGEVLARSLDGTLPGTIGRRVLANGSVYIGMAQLTVGQQLLLSLPDERLVDGSLVGPEAFQAGLAGTFASEDSVDADELEAQWLLMHRDDGELLLPRTIRYIEERREREGRWTGAIERHPAPLTIVWGALDPVAVVAMTDRLLAARSDATLRLLDDIGHYPMVEAPDRFVDGVLVGLA